MRPRSAESATDLETAISAWKQASQRNERLSDVARSRILAHAADRSRREKPLKTLFFPFKRLAFAGALPLLLLAVLTATTGYVTYQGLGAVPGPAATPILVNKAAGEVVFTIANGNRAHTVHLSTTPDRFDHAPGFTTRDGAFRDSLQGGPDLVFYRID